MAGARADPCWEQRTVSPPRDLVGFAASGGGYRAALFHLGALIRSNELGWLQRIHRYSAVSGGAICLGALAAAWPDLDFVAGVARNFDRLVTRRLLRFTERRIDIWATLWGLVPGHSPGEVLARAYRELVGDLRLKDLPTQPQFVFNASSLQTGVVVRLTRAYIRDYRAGCLAYPDLAVARAIAASSAFPPYLSPYVLRLDGAGLSGGDPALSDEAYRRRLVLTDGGVYDNLALQTLTSFRTVIASDAGSPGRAEPRPSAFYPAQVVRVLSIANEQTRALRRSHLVDDLKAGRRQGALWTIKTDIGRYPRPVGPELLAVDPTQIARLSAVGTRLWPMRSPTRAALVNWGYALADAGLRSRLGADGPPPAWPFPGEGLERPYLAAPALASEGLDEP